jgi:hypothetical protein
VGIAHLRDGERVEKHTCATASGSGNTPARRRAGREAHLRDGERVEKPTCATNEDAIVEKQAV